MNANYAIFSQMYHDDFTPRFTVDTLNYNKEYRSLFGPFFLLPGIAMPGQGGDEARTAVARMLELRKPELIGYSERLANNQRSIRRLFRNQLHRFKVQLEQHIIRDECDVEKHRWLTQPHDKKFLRYQTENEIILQGRHVDNDKKYIGYKFKNGELLSGENGIGYKKRAIGDLGCVRTQRTAYVCESIKLAWSNVFNHGRLRSMYVKAPDQGILKDVFSELLSPNDKLVFCYHSDDAIFSANCSDGFVICDGDIAKCDGSHRNAMFDSLYHMLAYDINGSKNCHWNALSKAFGYLKLPIKMRNKFVQNESVMYRFKCMRLYSGSVLTTIVNNFANLLISLAFERRVPDPSKVTRAQLVRSYHLAAEDVGYIVKAKECTHIEESTFLKHSPTYVDGELVLFVGLGVWIRGFGTFRGDLPGRGDYNLRAKAFNSDVVYSRKNWGNHIIRDSFWHLYSPHSVRMTGTAYREAMTAKSIGGTELRIPIENLCRRYSLAASDVLEACGLLLQANTGSLLSHPVFERFYKVDYG
jgi:hypothetical protein